ncbi:kinesin motor domain-containing protein, partial [Globomyces pollinis-pini]
GFNGTIIAYGQTGSGKTYTMGTGVDTNAEGIVPLAAKQLYLNLEEKAKTINDYTYQVDLSYLEIYNEDVIDLLTDEPAKTPIPIRFDKKNGNIAHGINIKNASNVTDILRYCFVDLIFSVLKKGGVNRQTASTASNSTSSRSHAIFSVIITQRFDSKELISKLNFVDLAGSERLKKTNASGDRAKEGISINSGLLTLGKVINSLASTKSRPNSAHIPYRDSKLTRLLQDSLGGTGHTLLISCISSEQEDIPESIVTLKFASRAMAVK